jgi:tRNA(Arg) A34 adenosine deaminase TadA
VSTLILSSAERLEKYLSEHCQRLFWSGDKLQQIRELEQRLVALQINSEADYFVWHALREALVSLHEGNYGIGAVLSKGRDIIAHGRNRVFFPRFDSKAHAEMCTMDDHELKMSSSGPRISGCTLWGTLEPCPMCYTRCLTSGVPSVFYAAADPPGGMVAMMSERSAGHSHMVWDDIAKGRQIALAPVTEAYRQLAWDCFFVTKRELDAMLMADGEH